MTTKEKPATRKGPAPGKPLDRAAILNADDHVKERVHVPEWGGDIFVRNLTAGQRDRYELECFVDGAGMTAALDGIGVRARLAIATVCDEAGDLLFTADDLEALAKKSGAALDRVYEVATRLNRVSDADVEELAKN